MLRLGLAVFWIAFRVHGHFVKSEKKKNTPFINLRQYFHFLSKNAVGLLLVLKKLYTFFNYNHIFFNNGKFQMPNKYP